MTLKVNLKGGIVSPGTLIQILEALDDAKIFEVGFGLRQQLLIKTKGQAERGSGLLELQEKLSTLQLDYELNADNIPNIISSYCAEDVFPTGQWLSEGVYKDIFDSFNFRPKLKINLSDSHQSFTPFFTGNLNFIASDIDGFWYLYLRFKQSNELKTYPVLVHSQDIAALCKELENRLLGPEKYNKESIFDGLYDNPAYISKVPNSPLALPKFSLPYYEGFNRYGDKTWLGIYRRSQQFSVQFLKDLCQLCLDTRIGQICVTPWKSLIIKGIENADRPAWDRLLGLHGINVRHAANELNWQTEDDSPEGLALKNYIINEFGKYDVRSFGLSFAIQTQPKSEVFGSIIIKKRRVLGPLLSVFDIYHSVDFNPNTREYELFERGLSKMHVPELLQRLTKKYYHQLSKNLISPSKPKAKAEEVTASKTLHQCPSCLSIYDADFGDVFNNIAPGLPFEQLPASYVCGVCESPKADFVAINASKVLA